MNLRAAESTSHSSEAQLRNSAMRALRACSSRPRCCCLHAKIVECAGGSAQHASAGAGGSRLLFEARVVIEFRSSISALEL